MLNDVALRRRVTEGLGAQAFTQIVNVVVQLASVPLFLHAWGVDVYGDWLIVTAIPVYLAMSDVGFTNAAMNEMTIAVSRGDTNAALASLHSAWLLTLAVTLGVLLVIVPPVLLLPVASWLGLTHIPAAGPVLALLSIQVLTGLQTGLVYAGFHCGGGYGSGQFLMACIRLLEFGLVALTVLLGGGPLAASAAFVGGRGVGTLGMRIILRRRTAWIFFGYRHASKLVLKRLIGPALAFTAFPLGNALNVQGILIVIGSTLGPVPTVTFNALRTMTRAGWQLISAIRAAVAAEVSAAFGVGNYVLLRQLHHRSCQAALWFSGALVLGLWIFGSEILSLWTHGAVAMNRATFVLLLWIAVPASLWLTSLNLAYATNRHERMGAVYLGVNLVTVVCAYAVARRFELPGIAAALLLADLLMAVYVVRTSLSLLSETLGHFARALLTAPGFAQGRSA